MNLIFIKSDIKQIYKLKNTFYERHVTLSKKDKKIKYINKKADKNLIKQIKKLNLINKGNIIEYPNESIKYLGKIAKKITKYNGALLIFDYGYTENKNENTLQSIKKHRYHNIFELTGNADITHHINYKLFLNVLKKNKLEIRKDFMK